MHTTQQNNPRHIDIKKTVPPTPMPTPQPIPVLKQAKPPGRKTMLDGVA